jgi:biopolymer transport protein ExbD
MTLGSGGAAMSLESAWDEDEMESTQEELPLKKPRKKMDDEMDITPMIDMTFLLLIYFIVTSIPDKSTAIELPKALHGDTVAQLKATVFTIGEGGLNNAPVFAADGKIAQFALSEDLDQRGKQIQEAVEKGVQEDHFDVVIKADKGVLHREVARVIKAVSRVPDVQIYLAVMETKER